MMDAGFRVSEAPIVTVTVAPDGLSAAAVAPRGAPIPREFLLDAFRRAGVTFGVDPAAVALLASGAHAGEVTFARGVAAVDGEDSRVEHLTAELAGAGFTAVEDQTGTVDLRGGHVAQHVTPGQVLAKKHPATPGTPGRKVTGEPIAPRVGKDIAALVAGNGAGLSPDRLSIVAKVGGLPKLVGAALTVCSACEVKNVDFHTGDIHFVGSVTVDGDVLHGFTVEATEDIVVRGHVDGGKLRAGGKITVNGGVRRAADIDALGDVAVRFVDPLCTLKSRHDVSVLESALQCTLTGRRVTVGRQLSAGTTTAWDRIEAQTIGSANEVATHLHLRIDPTPPSGPALDQARASLEHARADLEKVRKSEATAGPDARLLTSLTLREVSLALTVHRLEEQLAEVGAPRPADPHHALVVVKHTMFPNVVLHFYTLTRKITAPLHNQTVRMTGDHLNV